MTDRLRDYSGLRSVADVVVPERQELETPFLRESFIQHGRRPALLLLYKTRIPRKENVFYFGVTF